MLCGITWERTDGQGPSCKRSPFMFDIIWLVLILGLFGVGLAYLSACERM